MLKRVAALLVLAIMVMSTGRFVRQAWAAPDKPFVSQTCSSQSVTLLVRWTSSSTASSQTWLDLSTSDNGWAPGTFVSAGPVNRSGSYSWSGITPGKQHYLRVNEQQADGSWQSSETLAFVSLPCALTPTSGLTNPAPNTVFLFGAGSGKYDSVFALPNDTMDVCTPRYVDAIVRLADISMASKLHARWWLNDNPVQNAGPDNVLPTTLIFSLLGINNLQVSGPVTIFFTLDFGGTPVPPGNVIVRVEIGTSEEPRFITSSVKLHC